ncbi:hypothetical protein [Microbacterium galbinum]|uniref:Uncharacterized protein n=1 Tax=Microbacterium galbinum TaxID=2851646 RepID=A0ABY4IWC8_9MICO|nr:hypothetical protein [Microbacterium galbinum]UPL15703.1 hypothetical protein KV396_14975 [Microbacterium galbinum]
MEVYQAVAPGTRMGFSHTKPIFVVDNLADLRGAAAGIVTLPVQIDWTPAHSYDLAEPVRIRTMYETVLREAGSEAEIAQFIARDLLIEHWSELNLPMFVEDAWEAFHPELRRASIPSEHAVVPHDAPITESWVAYPSLGRSPRAGSPGRVDRTVILSRALHAAVEPYVLADWERAREIMLRNIAKQIPRARSPLARGWLSEWEDAIRRGPEAVIDLSRLEGEHGNDLRQMTPLAGVLPFEIQRKIALELPRNES